MKTKIIKNVVGLSLIALITTMVVLYSRAITSYYFYYKGHFLYGDSFTLGNTFNLKIPESWWIEEVEGNARFIFGKLPQDDCPALPKFILLELDSHENLIHEIENIDLLPSENKEPLEFISGEYSLAEDGNKYRNASWYIPSKLLRVTVIKASPCAISVSGKFVTFLYSQLE